MKFTKKTPIVFGLCIIISQLDASSNPSALQKFATTTALLTAAAATAGGIGYEMGKNADLQPGKTYKVTHPDTNIARTFNFDTSGKITISSQLKNRTIWHPNNYTGVVGNQITIHGKHIVATNFFQPNAINQYTALTVETFRQTNFNENPKSSTFTTISQDEQRNFVKKDNSILNVFDFSKKNSYTSEDIAFQFGEKGDAQKIHNHLNFVEAKK
ncbi:MAG: hypothetical protein ACXWL5_00600 [Candidatus Chromulinivorax sp.]